MSKLLGRLAEEESKFLDHEFLAPSLRGKTVRVRIAGAVCQIRIQPENFQGWGVFHPVSYTEALLVRQATLAERRGYLELFPLVRLVVCSRAGSHWLCSAASFGDQRFQVEGLAPVELAEEVQTFDAIYARYDGAQFWFDEADPRHDPGTAAFLRSALEQSLPPADLDRPGLTLEERAAYELNYFRRVQTPDDAGPTAQEIGSAIHRRRSRKARADDPGAVHDLDPVRRRLLESLSHGGAQLVDYLERNDSYSVTYSVGGRRYTSAVDKQDLTVQVAGICLSGEDQKFDLGSLVGVLREANGAIVRVGDENYGMDEELYWQAHPPRNR